MQGCSRVIIRANDTDIIVMGLYHCAKIPNMKEMWIQKSMNVEICLLAVNTSGFALHVYHDFVWIKDICTSILASGSNVKVT